MDINQARSVLYSSGFDDTSIGLVQYRINVRNRKIWNKTCN